MKKIKLVEEFKAFISKGNIVDMAVGVVVGGAFGKIVTSLVSDLIMPLVGLITGGGSLKDMFVVLGDRTGFDPAKYTTPALAAEAGYATLNYGNFIQTVLDFLIIALAIFLVIKLMATAKSKLIHEKVEEPAPRPRKSVRSAALRFRSMQSSARTARATCPKIKAQNKIHTKRTAQMSSPFYYAVSSTPPSRPAVAPPPLSGAAQRDLSNQKPIINPPFSA